MVHKYGKAHVSRKFLIRVYLTGGVDTRKYRYIVEYGFAYGVIKRLPIEWLDTTRAIDGWEEVARIFD